jgi:hypothetical protein
VGAPPARLTVGSIPQQLGLDETVRDPEGVHDRQGVAWAVGAEPAHGERHVLGLLREDPSVLEEPGGVGLDGRVDEEVAECVQDALGFCVLAFLGGSGEGVEQQAVDVAPRDQALDNLAADHALDDRTREVPGTEEHHGP